MMFNMSVNQHHEQGGTRCPFHRAPWVRPHWGDPSSTVSELPVCLLDFSGEPTNNMKTLRKDTSAAFLTFCRDSMDPGTLLSIRKAGVLDYELKVRHDDGSGYYYVSLRVHNKDDDGTDDGYFDAPLTAVCMEAVDSNPLHGGMLRGSFLNLTSLWSVSGAALIEGLQIMDDKVREQKKSETRGLMMFWSVIAFVAGAACYRALIA